MNRRRELTLQRVSRIGGITARDRYPQNTKERTTNAFTIEEALGTYMTKEDTVYDLRGQDTYTRSDRDSKQSDQEQFARHWDISDTFNGLMAIPNLIGVLTLSGTVIKITKNYIARTFHSATEPPMLSAFEDIQKEQENKWKATHSRL